MEDIVMVCGKITSKGTYFCTQINCPEKYWSEGMIELKEGGIYVLKTSEKSWGLAFVTPHVPGGNIIAGILDMWRSMNLSLNSWTETFRLVKNTLKTKPKVTATNSLMEENNLKSSRAFKTKKRKNPFFS